MDIVSFTEIANELGQNRQPFFFLLDFELKKPIILPLHEAAENGFFFKVKGQTNVGKKNTAKTAGGIRPVPMPQQEYARAFELVKKQLKAGNTYLLNLTFPTPLEGELSMEYIFQKSTAPYTLWHKDNFVLFSPECFVKIKQNKIYSYPMKGTIDAAVPDAEKIILQNKKEHWEHNTIVDLIRNDLSIVSTNVHVNKFRYIDRLTTSHKELLQVSSEIAGDLPDNWQNDIGSLLIRLLPAGSISGAPKAKTTEIIRESEQQDRGYFTGIFGIFNGDTLDSAVNIRFIENTDAGYQFRSGGGITANSIMEEEYREMINKVYVPFA